MPDALPFLAGAAQRVITPAVGTPLAGYASRAAGDLRSRYVHDDLLVKALVVRSGARGWGLIAADLIGVDAVAVARLRQAVASRTDLAPESILVCGTHTHAGPPVCPIAGAVSPENLNAVRADGTVTGSYGRAAALSPTAYYAGEVDQAWKESFLTQAVETAVEAWAQARPAELAYGETEVQGVASSRRVLLSDGSWADPRRETPAGAQVVSRSQIDPRVRVLAVRDRATGAPLAAVVNYASHPWVFNTSGLSAELPGAAARQVARAWQAPGQARPVVLHLTGPEGDATLIWNIDVDKVWRSQPGESLQDSLPRRERAFHEELERLSQRLAERVMAVLGGLSDWSQPGLDVVRREVLLPLKPGYRPPAEIQLADWQHPVPEAQHRTEIQLLRAGGWAILGLPGEPFSSLALRIRAGWPLAGLLIAAIANDYGPVSYLAEAEEFAQGGYELVVTPAGPGAGDVLVEAAVGLLRAAAGGGENEDRPD